MNKVKKIILTDNCCVQDLIYLKNEVTEFEIYQCIQQVKDRNQEYLDEDIINAISYQFGIEDIEDIENILRFEF